MLQNFRDFVILNLLAKKNWQVNNLKEQYLRLMGQINYHNYYTIVKRLAAKELVNWNEKPGKETIVSITPSGRQELQAVQITLDELSKVK